ncbi:MAG: Uma2 family endonuclease [Oscillospiraceae bacterium]|nr:Uma2 family endonuclease [Oscillospiraceae bacterium]
MRDYASDNFISDERRSEIIDGKIYLMATPNEEHVQIQGNLFSIFNQYFKQGKKKCIAVLARDLYINAKNYLVPDLLIYCQNNNEKKNRKVPLIVVEILSDSTWRRDFTVKMKKYAEMGIEEYWIIDQNTQRLIIFKLENSIYEKNKSYKLPWEDEEMPEKVKNYFSKLFPEDEIIKEFSPAFFPELVISLEDIFNFENLDIL